MKHVGLELLKMLKPVNLESNNYTILWLRMLKLELQECHFMEGIFLMAYCIHVAFMIARHS